MGFGDLSNLQRQNTGAFGQTIHEGPNTLQAQTINAFQPTVQSPAANSIPGSPQSPNAVGSSSAYNATQRVNNPHAVFEQEQSVIQNVLDQVRQNIPPGLQSRVDPLLAAIMQRFMGEAQEIGPQAIHRLRTGRQSRPVHEAGGMRTPGGGGQGQGGAYTPSGDNAERDWIIQHESGGDVNSRNPSGAFGLGQLMPGNRQKYAAEFGFDPDTTDPGQQTQMMDAYVRDRYGNYDNAIAFWRAHNWY